jgi:hypothetical protein
MVIFSLKTFLSIAGNWLVRLAHPVCMAKVFLTKLGSYATSLMVAHVQSVIKPEIASRKGWQRPTGKLGEYSDKSERGEPMCPKIHPNFSWMKVRTRFPPSDSLEKRRVLFKRKEAIQIYISCLSRVGFGCSMSSIVSALSEASAQNPIIGPDLSEYSPNLPPTGQRAIW